MARSRQALDQADLILLVCDGTQESGEEDTALLDQALDQADTLLVMNKSDLPGYGCPMFRAEDTAHTLSVVGLSAKTGLGLEFLKRNWSAGPRRCSPKPGSGPPSCCSPTSARPTLSAGPPRAWPGPARP
ncbi:MAG: hypothetical protein ACLSF6_09975 [Evtepia gabavorous]